MSKSTTKKAATKNAVTEPAPPKKAKAIEWPAPCLPEEFYIIGLDDGFREGDPHYDAQLDDPERLTPPNKGYVETMIRHGHPEPVQVIVRSCGSFGPKCKIVVNGRQHVMGARAANELIGDKADPIKVPYYVVESANALDVRRANEWARRDSPLAKARSAVRLINVLGYSEAEVIETFSDDGQRPITKMTLINWKRAANCCPEIQSGFDVGDYPITILYEIGKIGYGKKMDPEEKRTKQLAALEKIKAEGGTLTGTGGRDNAAGAVGETDGEENGDGGTGENSGGGGGGGSRMRSSKLSAGQVRELVSTFEPEEETDENAFTDLDKNKVPHKEYTDGDFQELSYAWLLLISGDDPKGERLKKFPSVFRHVKKILRSE